MRSPLFAIVRVAAASLTLAGCCSSADVVQQVTTVRETQNTSRQRAEVQRYIAEHKLTLIDAPAVMTSDYLPAGSESPEKTPEPRVLAQDPERGLGSAERLLSRSPEDPPGLVFEGPGCLRGSSCGCGVPSTYAFARAPDGRIVVLRPTPKVETERVRQCGECSVGCGQPGMPTPPVRFRLPVSDPAQVEVVPVSFTYVAVAVSCSTETPAP